MVKYYQKNTGREIRLFNSTLNCFVANYTCQQLAGAQRRALTRRSGDSTRMRNRQLDGLTGVRSRLTDPGTGDDRRGPRRQAIRRDDLRPDLPRARHQRQLLRQEISDPRTWSVVASSFVIIRVPRLLLRHRSFSQASSRVKSKWPFFLQTRRSISFVGYIDGNISPMTERDRSIPITGAVCKAFTVHKVTVILPSHQLTSTCMRWNCDYHFLNHKDRTITNTMKLMKVHTLSARDGHFFSNRVVNVWNSLSDSVILSPTVTSFKHKLHTLDLSCI